MLNGVSCPIHHLLGGSRSVGVICSVVPTWRGSCPGGFERSALPWRRIPSSLIFIAGVI